MKFTDLPKPIISNILCMCPHELLKSFTMKELESFTGSYFEPLKKVLIRHAKKSIYGFSEAFAKNPKYRSVNGILDGYIDMDVGIMHDGNCEFSHKFDSSWTLLHDLVHDGKIYNIGTGSYEDVLDVVGGPKSEKRVFKFCACCSGFFSHVYNPMIEYSSDPRYESFLPSNIKQYTFCGRIRYMCDNCVKNTIKISCESKGLYVHSCMIDPHNVSEETINIVNRSRCE